MIARANSFAVRGRTQRVAGTANKIRETGSPRSPLLSSCHLPPNRYSIAECCSDQIGRSRLRRSVPGELPRREPGLLQPVQELRPNRERSRSVPEHSKSARGHSKSAPERSTSAQGRSKSVREHSKSARERSRWAREHNRDRAHSSHGRRVRTAARRTRLRLGSTTSRLSSHTALSK